MESDVKFNDYCYQMDAKQWGFPKLGAVYLVQSQKTALIDSGMTSTVQDIQKALTHFQIDISKIDYMIITHEHYDHGAGAALLLEQMPKAKVYASEPTSKVLRQPEESLEITKLYSGELKSMIGPFPPVGEVNIVKEGDTFELGKGVVLEVKDFPGHTPGSIGLFESKTKTLFAGDAVCIYYEEFDFYLSPSAPDLFDYQAYLNSIRKISSINANYLCLGHFGTFMPPKAKQVISKANEMAQDLEKTITRIYRETMDENKVYEALFATYGQNRYLLSLPEMVQRYTLGTTIKGYLLSLKLE